MVSFKYINIARMSLMNGLVYLWDFFVGAFFIALIVFVFVNLWRVVYGRGDGVIEGFTIAMMIWYFVMTESITTTPGRVVEDIGNDIQSGNIAQQLNKPYNYILFQYAMNMGQTILRFLVTLGVGGLVAYFMVGGFDISLSSVPFIAICIFLALTLHFMIMALLGIAAFWMEDAKAIQFLYQKFIFVMGGMLVPLEIFPQWLETIAKFLPVSYIAYAPAKLWVMFDFSSFLKVAAIQVAWIAITAVCIFLAYRLCIKNLSINGG